MVKKNDVLEALALNIKLESGGFFLPFPSREFNFALSMSQEQLNRIGKDGGAVIIHPLFPKVGVLAKIAILGALKEQQKHLLRFSLSERADILEMVKVEDSYFVRFRDFEKVPIGKDEFKGKECSQAVNALIESAFNALKRMGLNPSREVMKEYTESPEDFEVLIDFLAGSLSTLPENPLVITGLAEVLAQKHVLLRAERLSQLFCWVEMKFLESGGIPHLPLEESMLAGRKKSKAEDKLDENLPEEVKKVIISQKERLEKCGDAEAGVITEYLNHLGAVPWTTLTEDEKDFSLVGKILDEDHFGLDKVKSKILDHLAVRRLNPSSKGAILCLVGPPGVGKTSIGKSVARSLKRKFCKLSLGGVKDEAALRGHRRTYIGAMPGEIVRALEHCGSRNPVFMLDEIDKLGKDSLKGGPEDALLEILDPEQNFAFSDHYMQVPIDLSQVMFIANANTYDIHPALLDRMEVIEIEGYCESEKIAIARNHLFPKQLSECGLVGNSKDQLPLIGVEMGDEVFSKLIRDYTREAGVRNLERSIHTVLQKVIRMHLDHKLLFSTGKALKIDPKLIEEYLGNPKTSGDFHDLGSLPCGSAVILMVSGNGEGKLGSLDVSMRDNDSFDRTISGNMQPTITESVKVAFSRHMHDKSVLRKEYKDIMLRKFFHVHANEAAIHKDGPSAGVMIYLAVASEVIKKFFTGTGELALNRQVVLPIGGLRAKILAADRAGIKEMFIPRANLNDLEDLPPEIKAKLHVVFPENVEDLSAFAAKEKEGLTIYCLNTPEEALKIAFENFSTYFLDSPEGGFEAAFPEAS